MTEKQKTKVSKFMSLILRHDPAAGGITLDENGWVSMSDLLKAVRSKVDTSITVNDILSVIETNDKQRFAYERVEQGIRVRANQGHSIEVDLKLEEKEPPAYLYHGTSTDNLSKILASGAISKMSRQHVHLSKDRETAEKVGKRQGGNLHIIIVDAYHMSKDGYKFYLSENGVWLTDTVPTKYFLFGRPQ